MTKGRYVTTKGSMLTDTEIWVSTDGDDSHPGSVVAPVKTLARAFALVTSTRKYVILMPGVYTSAAALAWPVGVSDMYVTGLGADSDSTEVHASAGTSVILIDPNTTIGAANVLCHMSNFTVSADNGIHGVVINNGNMTASKKLITTFRNMCFASDDDTTEYSIKIEHDDADSLIKTYIHGRGMGGCYFEGKVFVDNGNAGDRFKCNGMLFEANIEFSTDDVASETEFFNCIMVDAGGSGGHDNQILRVNNCISKDGNTWAICDLGDFADNAEEAFLSLS